MKLFDTKKKRIIFISVAVVLSVAAVLAIVLPLALLLPSRGDRTPVWKDKLEPEEIEEIEITSPAVKLPEKPSAPPTTDKTKPSEFGAASASDECYAIGAEDGFEFTVSYSSNEPLPAFAYVYVPVTNYDGNAYLKIKADCNGVERLSVLAVYYEQYEQSRPAVTVYNNSVMDGQNTIICELGSSAVLDSSYNMVLGENLTQKTVCGFMLMIDSNPKQVIDEYSGTFKVTEMAVVDENDPDLNKLYASPVISAWKASEGFASNDISVSRPSDDGSLDANIEYSVAGEYPRVEATISNYKPAYTTVKMDIKGVGVKTLTVAIKYNLKSSSDSIDYNYLSSFGMSVSGEWETYEFDFSVLEELKDWDLNTVPGSYVKNLNPSAIYFFVDGGMTNTGTLSVRNVTFEKPKEGGAPRVTSTWTLGAAGITKSNVSEGGIGTLDYDKWQAWNPVTVNVASYNKEYASLTVRVKFYSEYSNLGIALGYGSDRTVILQSDGMTPEDGFGVKLVAHTQETGEDENGAYTFHTLEIDFSKATTIRSGDKLLAEQAITKILLYVDAGAPNRSGVFTVPNAGAAMTPARKMQFVGMEFKKPSGE